MFDYSKADEAIRRIIDAANPRLIIVFGSVARHEADEHSDLDLLVVFDEVDDHRKAYSSIARQFIGLKLPFDLVVMSVRDFNHYKENEFSFTHEIVTTGKVVYEKNRVD